MIQGPVAKPNLRNPDQIFTKNGQDKIRIDLNLPPLWEKYRPLGRITLYIYRLGGMRIVIKRSDNDEDVDLSLFCNNLQIDFNVLINELQTHLGEVFGSLKSTFYVGPFRHALPMEAKAKFGDDLDVGLPLMQKWNEWKAGEQSSVTEQCVRLSDSIGAIFGYNRFEINTSSSGTVFKLVIDGESYELSEMGGGLAQFLIVLINVMLRQPEYILIDEPELNLHPPLQLDFLTTLGSFAKQGVLYATHSIGLARSSATPIYSVHRRDGRSQVQLYEDTQDLAEVLGSMNYASYRDLGFNQVLLVEGVHDVRTIQQFLRLLKIDHQVVLIPLNGSAGINGTPHVTHQIAEMKRLCPGVSALIDRDPTQGEEVPANRRAFIEACKAARVNCHILERRAIENYVSERAIRRVKSEKYRALAPMERLDSVAHGWGKQETWRIAREMTLPELEDTRDLFRFLKGLMA